MSWWEIFCRAVFAEHRTGLKMSRTEKYISQPYGVPFGTIPVGKGAAYSTGYTVSYITF